jgi:TP901 family phage tail tape measure protein
LGVAAIGAPVGLIAGFSKLVTIGAGFQKQMSNVKAFVSATDAELQQLSDTAEGLGASTAFTAAQAAAAMTEMGKAGLSANQILGASEGVLTLAAAGDIEMAEAATIAAAALNQFGIPASQMGSVVDKLAKASSSGSISLAGMGTQLSYAASTAMAFGMDIGETSGILATLATTLGEDKAGTSFRSMLTSLQAPTGAAAAQLKSLGVSLTDSAGKFLTLPAIVEQFSGALAGMSDGDKAAALNAIFNTRGLPAFSTLMSQGADGMREMTAAVNDSEGFGLEVADTKLDNVSGGFEKLKSAVSGFAINVFQLFEGPLQTSLENTAAFVAGPMIDSLNVMMEWLGAFVSVTKFTWDNFALIAGIGIDTAGLLMVGFFADVMHFFTSDMPAILSWMFDNWSTIWRDMLAMTLGILDNMGQNVRNFSSAVWDTIKSLGKTPLTFDMVPMMDGIRTTTAALELTPRVAGSVEQELSSSIAQSSAALGTDFDSFLSEATAGISDVNDVVESAASIPEPAGPILDVTRGTGEEEKKGKEKDSLGIAMKGSKEAFKVINRAIKGGKDAHMKTIAKQSEKQTGLLSQVVAAVTETPEPVPTLSLGG